MKNSIIGAGLFLAGAAIGSVVTWKVMDKKCNERIEAELSDMEAFYKDKYSTSVEEEEDEEESDKTVADVVRSIPKPDITDYATMVEKNGYVDYNGYSFDGDPIDEDELRAEELDEHPTEIIEPDEFGEQSDYGAQYLTLWDNGVITNDLTGKRLDESEIIECLGDIDVVDEIGKYEEGLLHVRNNKYKIDYEITHDLEDYEED